jgi:tetratricopeptide (TPR) repeat protein
MRRLIRNFIFLFFLAPALLHAQQPAMHEAFATYKEAQELYDMGKYGAAKEQFRRYLQIGDRRSSLANTDYDLMADALFFKGMCSFHLLNSDAKGTFADFLHQYPLHAKHDEALYHIGKLHYIRKEYKEAVPYLQQVETGALSKDQVTECRFMLGYGYYKDGNSQKAKEKFGQIRLANGTYGEMGAYYYAIIAYQEGQYAEAYEAFKRVKPDAKYAENLDVLKASCLLKLGRYDELDELGRELMANKENANLETWFILANASFERSRWADCIRYFEEFEQRRGRMNREAQYRLGFAHYKNQEPAKAVERFTKALVPDDEVAQSAYYYLGHAYLKQEDFAHARTAFKQASENKANPAIASEALFLYAKASFETRFFDDALDAMRRYLETNSTSSYATEAKGLIGEMLVYASNFKDAIDYLEQNDALRTPRSQLAYQRACYYYALEQYEKSRFDVAADYFKKAFNNRQDPAITLPAYFWFAESQFRKEDFKAAGESYENFLKQPYAAKHEYHPLAYYGLGWSQLRQEKYAEALEGFEKYISLADRQRDKETYTDAMLRAGDCELLLKHYENALKYYKQVRDYNHRNVDYALLQMGKVYFRENDYQKSAESYVQLVTNYRKSVWRDEALLSAADIYLTWLNDWSSCAKYCRMLEKDHPDSKLLPDALLRLAVAEQKGGNNANAVKYFKSVAFEHCQNETARTAALASMADLISAEEYDQVEAESRKRCPFNSQDAVTGSAEDLAISIADQRFFEDNYTSAIERYTNYLNDFRAGKHRYQAHYYRGQSYEKTKQLDKALEDYEAVYSADRIGEFTLKALKAAAEIQFAKGNSLAAMELYASMEGRSDKLEDRLNAQFGKANIHLANKDYEAARRELSSIYTDPNTTEYSRTKARVAIAACDYHLNRKDEAYQNFVEVEAANKNVFGAESQYYITRILYERGSYEQSRDTALYMFKTYQAYNIWKARATAVLAEDYIQLGDTFQAVGSTLPSLTQQNAFKDLRDAAQTRLDGLLKVWSGARPAAPEQESEPEKQDPESLIEIKKEGDE